MEGAKAAVIMSQKLFSLLSTLSCQNNSYCAVAYSAHFIKFHSKHRSLEGVALLRQEGAILTLSN